MLQPMLYNSVYVISCVSTHLIQFLPVIISVSLYDIFFVLVAYKMMPQHWKYIQSLSWVHSVRSLVESAYIYQHIFCVNRLFFFLKYFCGQFLYFSFSTHKQCILSHFIHNSTAMIPWKPYTLVGFEPGSLRSCGGCDVHCATPPGRVNGPFARMRLSLIAPLHNWQADAAEATLCRCFHELSNAKMPKIN
jgi:hypothetical protein